MIAAVTVGIIDCRKLAGIESSGHGAGQLHVRSFDYHYLQYESEGLLHVELVAIISRGEVGISVLRLLQYILEVW